MPAMTLRAALALTAALLATAPLPAAAQVPIFDAHIHYSRPDWDGYPPERALSILARAGVRRAIVSSTPDDGTLKLYEPAPKSIVPFLRPYRTREDMAGWGRRPPGPPRGGEGGQRGGAHRRRRVHPCGGR